jgi:hypothetical protein
MDIVVNLQPIYDFFGLSTGEMLIRIIYIFGWLPITVLMLWGLKEVWLNNIVTAIWASKQTYNFLAIDIPRGNIQSPRAVEDLFNYLAGAHGSINLIEKYWDGKFQQSFSLEIVSLDGYTQFIIRTPSQFRNLVEAAIYAQYPDAEITEIDDYARDMPSRFPDEEWEMWGSEFMYAKNQAFPIKTYPEFEHDFGKPEFKFRDPMAALMDLCGSLRKGEQLWYQIIIKPIDFKWTETVESEVAKVIGEKTVSKPDIVDHILGASQFVIDAILGGVESKDEKKDEMFKLMNLKPNAKKQMEAIYQKASKIGFETKIRVVYIAKKEVLNKPKVVNGFVGYLKQFAALDLNNLKPDTEVTATSTSYFRKEPRLRYRQNRLMANFKSRDGYAGRNPKVMNVEELATLWHFPIDTVVRAPLVQKAPGRKGEPPMGLPFGEQYQGEGRMDENRSKPDFLFDIYTDQPENNENIEEIPEVRPQPVEKGAPPPNLPFA